MTLSCGIVNEMTMSWLPPPLPLMAFIICADVLRSAGGRGWVCGVCPPWPLVFRSIAADLGVLAMIWQGSVGWDPHAPDCL